ncbi:PRC-barrel domain-containing protein [Calothrix sp. NIES-4071]|nr:PRC-barrel domain-containing protein [Calothrix sp. NIES-4071]BAZ54624.1 PRC-barrel domain-containing protein [Calothrix sp. NIES-4105]
MKWVVFVPIVIDTGFWIFGKQLLLPIGRTRIFPGSKRVYALGFTKVALVQTWLP